MCVCVSPFVVMLSFFPLLIEFFFLLNNYKKLEDCNDFIINFALSTSVHDSLIKKRSLQKAQKDKEMAEKIDVINKLESLSRNYTSFSKNENLIRYIKAFIKKNPLIEKDLVFFIPTYNFVYKQQLMPLYCDKTKNFLIKENKQY